MAKNFIIATFWVDYYLVGFFICAENLGMLKKNRLEKLVPSVKRSAWLQVFALQNFDRQHLFDVNKVFDVYKNFVKRLHVWIFLKVHVDIFNNTLMIWSNLQHEYQKRATRVRHKQNECNTSATRVRHECYSNDTMWQVKDYKEWNDFILSTTFGNASFPCQNAFYKCTTKTGLCNGKSYIKKFYILTTNSLARSRIVTHSNAASFSIKTISCENTNIPFSNNYWKLCKMNAKFCKNIYNKGKVRLNSFEILHKSAIICI